MQKSSGAKKVFKIIGIVLLLLLALCILFVGGVFIFDKIKDSEEWDKLDQAGYVNKVSVGNYSVNVCLRGNENAEHTLVSVQGLGTMSNAVELEPLIDKLGDRCRFAIVDRVGYALSDDSSNEQTVEQIVSDYRTALTNGGIQAPYILMAHSIGGVYASYWQNAYPDEIEAVIYLDATQIGNYENMGEEDMREATTDMYIEAIAVKLGLDRVFFDPSELVSVVLNEQQKEYAAMLWSSSPISWASCSEEDHYYDNICTTMKSLAPNDIPKLYIDANAYRSEDGRDKIEYYNKSLEAIGNTEDMIDLSDENILKDLFDEQEAKIFYDKCIQPYIDKLGSVTYVNIPGDHYIHLHKPDEVAAACNEFLDNLDKNQKN